MAADLHIHVLEGVTEDDVKLYNCNVWGSRHFDMARYKEREARWRELVTRIGGTPNCWVGEVSWLKANLSGDYGTYVPATVETVTALIGDDFPVLTTELEKKILDAFELHNITQYRIATKETVATFLAQHRGKRLFVATW